MKIINKTGYRFVEWKVRRLLRHVPPSDLEGLGNITLLKKCEQKEYSRYRGLYYSQEENGEYPYFELYIDEIFEGYYSSFNLLMPLMGSRILGEVLYHEIGHHRFRDVEEEDFAREERAEDYVSQMLDKIRPSKLIMISVMGLFFYPLALLSLIVLRTKKAVTNKLDGYEIEVMAMMYNGFHSHTEAKKLSEEMLARGYRREKPYVYIGDYYWSRKKYEDAKTWWKKGAMLSPYRRGCRNRLKKAEKGG
jgi:hypothetical protein